MTPKESLHVRVPTEVSDVLNVLVERMSDLYVTKSELLCAILTEYVAEYTTVDAALLHSRCLVCDVRCHTLVVGGEYL